MYPFSIKICTKQKFQFNTDTGLFFIFCNMYPFSIKICTKQKFQFNTDTAYYRNYIQYVGIKSCFVLNIVYTIWVR